MVSPDVHRLIISSMVIALESRDPSRPEPNKTGLGEGAQRVEHVEADFLAKPEEIAASLREKIKKM